jgi:hypothetical protein
MAAPASNLVVLDNTRKFVCRWEHVGRGSADSLRKRVTAAQYPLTSVPCELAAPISNLAYPVDIYWKRLEMKMKMKRAWIASLFLVLLVAVMAVPVTAGMNINLLENSDFDGPLERAGTLSPWTVTHGNGDKLKCEVLRAAPLANSQPCMFKFRGGETATILRQKLNTDQLNNVNGFLNCSNVNLAAWFYLYAAQTPDVRLSVKLKYTDSRVTYTQKSAEAVLPLLGSWQQVGSSLLSIPVGAEVSSVTYQIRHGNLAGKVYVDDAHLDLIPFASIC